MNKKNECILSIFQKQKTKKKERPGKKMEEDSDESDDSEDEDDDEEEEEEVATGDVDEALRASIRAALGVAAKDSDEVCEAFMVTDGEGDDR